MGERDIALAPGGSETVDVLAAPKYEIDVFAPEDPSGATYKESLLTLRDQLETLSLHPENPSADAGGALIELGVVESALQQMPTSETYQSCSSPIKSGVPGQVTVTWNPSPLDSGGIWALSCG
jgi:hypothetical protein